MFLGGSGGAMARFGLSQYIGQRSSASLPVATLIINSLGCLLIGFLIASPFVHTAQLLLLDVGFTGAFTTFSTFSFETVRLLEQGEYGIALANAVLSVGLGLLMVVAGTWLGGNLT